jgi:hypothetical protein
MIHVVRVRDSESDTGKWARHTVATRTVPVTPSRRRRTAWLSVVARRPGCPTTGPSQQPGDSDAATWTAVGRPARPGRPGGPAASESRSVRQRPSHLNCQWAIPRRPAGCSLRGSLVGGTRRQGTGDMEGGKGVSWRLEGGEGVNLKKGKSEESLYQVGGGGITGICLMSLRSPASLNHQQHLE